MTDGRAVNSLSVFFPCYNEQENVQRVTQESLKVLDGLGVDYELIIVNDGSSDNTAEIAAQLAEENSQVRLINHEVNKGYGAALQSGFRAAQKDFIFYTDGDGQFDINEIDKTLKLISECDIVSCYRIKRRDSLMRKLNAFCWTSLVGVLFGMRIKDIDCAFKLYRRQVIDSIEMKSTGALIDTEMLARSLKKGFRVKQVGVHHYPRTAGVQTGAKISVILRAFKELFALYREIKKSEKN